MCAAIENGETQEAIEREAVQRGCWVDERDCRRRLREARAVALELVEGNNQTLAVAQAAIELMGLGWRLLSRLARGVVVLRPAAPLLILIEGQIVRVTADVAARRAANDALFQRVANL